MKINCEKFKQFHSSFIARLAENFQEHLTSKLHATYIIETVENGGNWLTVEVNLVEKKIILILLSIFVRTVHFSLKFQISLQKGLT